MTHQPYDERREPRRLADIIARDERNPTFGKQVLNGISGLLVLMVTGVLIVLLVLWKSP
ncbi:hypothetical protein SAMN05428969_3739 [Devosia sp. YR412]|uniref:hypothetical protein n=1 Tax=Devosia sp. YR412 TaxID=1881030 RepID=UPI0008B33D3E|nr:hypothetical protein [Devosia sp. YR412]SEQ62440.1 hypothetical protein SAMN05428969_3739 [Devosia sp. YR412]